jgi:hypothetical protein
MQIIADAKLKDTGTITASTRDLANPPFDHPTIYSTFTSNSHNNVNSSYLYTKMVANESKIQLAISAWENGEYQSMRKCAKDFNVHRGTSIAGRQRRDEAGFYSKFSSSTSCLVPHLGESGVVWGTKALKFFSF